MALFMVQKLHAREGVGISLINLAGDQGALRKELQDFHRM